MLIEFSVKNFRSVREKVVLSMVAANGKEQANTLLIEATQKLKVLPFTVIYGANAAGKSNVINAYWTMREMILQNPQLGERLPLIPFQLDAKTANEPTEMEIIFIADDGIRYQYGFSATDNEIQEEWLFSFPNNTARTLFSRSYEKKSKKTNIKLGKYFKGAQKDKKSWVNQTLENALFLSTAIQLNNQQLRPVFEWFRTKSQRMNTLEALEKKNYQDRIVQAMKAADLGIESIVVEREEIPPAIYDFFHKANPESEERFEDKFFYSVKTLHKVKGGKDILFDLKAESDGTRKFFQMIGPLLDALDNGKVIAIDEINESIHTLLFHHIVDMFNDPKSNPNGAQLICTTHDTTLLDQKKLRRDQVWFVEKTSENSTDLYPLTEYSPRTGRADIQKNYLSGRYGALPYLEKILRNMGIDNG